MNCAIESFQVCMIDFLVPPLFDVRSFSLSLVLCSASNRREVCCARCMTLALMVRIVYILLSWLPPRESWPPEDESNALTGIIEHVAGNLLHHRLGSNSTDWEFSEDPPLGGAFCAARHVRLACQVSRNTDSHRHSRCKTIANTLTE